MRRVGEKKDGTIWEWQRPDDFVRVRIGDHCLAWMLHEVSRPYHSLHFAGVGMKRDQRWSAAGPFFGLLRWRGCETLQSLSKASGLFLPHLSCLNSLRRETEPLKLGISQKHFFGWTLWILREGQRRGEVLAIGTYRQTQRGTVKEQEL